MYKIVHEPTSDDLNQMVVSSAGDIRSAINALEFFCSAMQGENLVFEFFLAVDETRTQCLARSTKSLFS